MVQILVTIHGGVERGGYRLLPPTVSLLPFSKLPLRNVPADLMDREINKQREAKVGRGGGGEWGEGQHTG